MKSYLNKLKIFLLLIILISLTSISSLSLLKDTNKNSLSVTNEHPFYLDGKWVKSSELIVGDELTTNNGKKAKIIKITDISKDTPIQVYNLEVGGLKNYFAKDILVHNKGMKNNGDRFYNVRTFEEKEVSDLYQEKFVLDSLVSQNQPGIISNEIGDFKDVYIIDPRSVNLKKLPDNLRTIVEDSDVPIVVKYSRNIKRSDLEDPVDLVIPPENSVQEFTDELIVSDKVNSEFRKQGLEELFPEKRYFGANFASSQNNVMGQAIIVEDYVPGYTIYDLMQSLENDYYRPYSRVPTELGDRAIDLGNKVNDKIMDTETKLREIFVKEKYYWYDVHDRNFAISFTDRSGKELSLKDIIDSDIDIDTGVNVHLKAYEVGGVDLNRNRGYLVEFDDLLINVPPVY